MPVDVVCKLSKLIAFEEVEPFKGLRFFNELVSLGPQFSFPYIDEISKLGMPNSNLICRDIARRV